MSALLRIECKQALAKSLPWTTSPLIVSAPMRVMTGPSLAVAVSSAGGLGFLGPTLKPEDVFGDLDQAAELIGSSSIRGAAGPSLLPVGVGFQTWNGNLEVAVSAVTKHRPCAVWLFAPRHGQGEFDEWTTAIKRASPDTRVWLQIGSLGEAVDAAGSATPPDVLVLQGAEAGGHGRHKDAQGTIALVPEVSDALRDSTIPLVAAGGIVDGRGAAAALALGAAGVAMGTRFLASKEARISKGYQDEVVRASDGARNTVRTQLYNHLRGTFGWPEQFSPRTIINKSWTDHESGVPFDRLKELHDESAKTGDAGWGPQGRLATYAGAAVGLVRHVQDAAVIVRETRDQARAILTCVVAHL
ncbi:2-nitropropane dioxygenase precursor [Metarhizium album ARSEF 1941]|uniref:2-nitropropane dioxygenase n=1 Tax=Metarhizium album (strain ARSEF 1941) TaxID=1081103 RepID=A0A0B2WH01_METAS|nr:2-nitropropane dioxygenase precursor [Metarhizium album ARSEF 1941]KHN95256.1 2-nitropropane dioxygenase precursor [Metarhizium album ARSEF 1941]